MWVSYNSRPNFLWYAKVVLDQTFLNKNAIHQLAKRQTNPHFALKLLSGEPSGPKTNEVDQLIFSNWVINSIKTLTVKINRLLISTININNFFQNFKFLNHFIIGDFIFGLGNFGIACVWLKAV